MGYALDTEHQFQPLIAGFDSFGVNGDAGDKTDGRGNTQIWCSIKNQTCFTAQFQRARLFGWRKKVI